MAGNMDKMIGWSSGITSNGTDSNWVQTNTTVLDNSSSNIAKTVQSIMLNASCYPTNGNKAYYAMLLVTAEDGVIPNFAGSDSAFNTALTAYRRLIWCTQSGIVKYAANGLVDDALIPFEPATKRVMKPGQKLVWIFMARNHGHTTAGDLNFQYDWNIWYDY